MADRAAAEIFSFGPHSFKKKRKIFQISVALELLNFILKSIF